MTIENNPMPSGGGSNNFQEIVKRFWGFDHLIGSVLIKIIYYIGLAFILLFTVMAMFGGGIMGAMMGGNGGGGGALMFILAPILGVVYLCFWRFICEMWLLMYLIFNRMGEIRDRLPPR